MWSKQIGQRSFNSKVIVGTHITHIQQTITDRLLYVEVIGNEFQSLRSTRDGKRLIISGCRCLLREQQFDDTTRAKTQPLTHYTRSLETQWDVS